MTDLLSMWLSILDHSLSNNKSQLLTTVEELTDGNPRERAQTCTSGLSITHVLRKTHCRCECFLSSSQQALFYIAMSSSAILDRCVHVWGRSAFSNKSQMVSLGVFFQFLLIGFNYIVRRNDFYFCSDLDSSV